MSRGTLRVSRLFYVLSPSPCIPQTKSGVLTTNLVNPEELVQAKNLLVHQLLLSRTSTKGIALGLLNLSQMDLPLDESMRAASNYRKITATQVQSAFSRWIRPTGFVQVTNGPEPK